MTGHPYPSNHKPGSHWSTDEAWQILDTLPVGKLDGSERAYLGGLIAGALMHYAEAGVPADAKARYRKLPKLRDLP